MKKFALLSLIVAASFLVFSTRKIREAREHADPKMPWAIEYSHDDRFFAVGGDDSTLYIFNSTNCKLYKKFKLSSAIKNLSWHRSDSFIAVGTMRNIQFVNTITGGSTIIRNVPGARGIAWNPKGDRLVVAGNGILYLVDENTNLLHSFKGPDNNSYLTVDWSVDDIITTGSDEVILFNTLGKQLSVIDHRKQYKTGVLTVRWHPSGEFFVSGDYGHEGEGIATNLQFRKKDGSLIRTINGHHAELRNVRWNKDGNLLATASDSLRIYNRNGDLIATGNTPSKYNIWGVCWSNDGKTIITCSFEGDHIDLWSASGKHIRQIF